VRFFIVSLFVFVFFPYVASNRKIWDFGCYVAEDANIKGMSARQQVLSLACHCYQYILRAEERIELL
jgi:hypothetical protein